MDHDGSGLTDQLIDEASELTSSVVERRSQQRHPFDGRIVMLLLSETGTPLPPIVVHGKNISSGGMCVVSRQMIHPESLGAIQLARTDGRVALIGIQVRYSVYVGNMRHNTGIEFVPLPPTIEANDFLDPDGKSLLG
jgi:hypothetical protein